MKLTRRKKLGLFPGLPPSDRSAWNHREDNDYYSQPGKLFRRMNAGQKKALFENTARAMGDAPKEVKVRLSGGNTTRFPEAISTLEVGAKPSFTAVSSGPRGNRPASRKGKNVDSG